MGSPMSGSVNLKGSIESIKNADRSLGTVSKHSLFDMVSSKINVNRSRAPQRYFSRESLAAGYGNRTIVSSDLELARNQKNMAGRRSQDRRGTLTAQCKSSVVGSTQNISNGNRTAMPDDFYCGRDIDKSPSIKKQRRPKPRYCGMRWTFVFDPAGRISYYWHMVVSLAFLYNLWVIIFRFAFCEITRDTIVIWFSFDYLSDFVYVMDIVINFRVGFLEDGVLQTDTSKLRQNYMNSTLFYFDCLCLLPLDFLYLSIGFNSILRLFRLVKVYRYCAFMDRTERHTNYPNLFRSVSLLHNLLATFHWNGCVYHLFNKNSKLGTGKNWNYTDSVASNDTLKLYLQSYYWCTLALTTIGDLPRPRSNFEYLFVISQLIFGLLLFATVLGHVASIVVNVGSARKEFQAKLDGVKTYMRMRRVPTPLQTKVIKWFDYLWLTQKCSDEEKAISCLPDKLKAEIAINVHLDTLRRVEIFQNTEAGFLCDLVLKLRPVLFSPGDYICRKGEVGKEMYIVNKGKLQLVGDDGKTVLVTLRSGSYFGEISILNMGAAGDIVEIETEDNSEEQSDSNLSLTGNRRTASVRSVGYSDLFVLSKKDLSDVLEEYPEAKKRLEEIAKQRLEKYNTDPDSYDIGLTGRRCKSTPGIIETNDRMPVEDMWMSPFNVNSAKIINSANFVKAALQMNIPYIQENNNQKPSPLASKKNMPVASPLSVRSSGRSSDHEQLTRQYSENHLVPHAIPTISQAISDNSGISTGELAEVVVLKAEINRLQEQLKDVENQNKFLNEKLTQQQWDMDHRLTELEMQMCRDTASSVGSSMDENERNRESVI